MSQSTAEETERQALDLAAIASERLALGALIDGHQLAALLNISERTVREKAAARLWPCTYVRGVAGRRFSRQDVDAILAGGIA